jgi:predicted alpha-1,2-mannosidase
VHLARGYTQYANFSGWDIYRSEVQLLAWLAPRQTGDMMQSLVADAEQGGWLPKWPVANDYTGEMDGDSADPIIADAYAFGARRFAARAALRLMLKGASRPGHGPTGYQERPQLADYLRFGYVPPATGGWGAAAQTLEYAVDDFSIAQLAGALGDGATAGVYRRRAQNWRNLFNPATGFVEPRFAGGSFPAAFDPRAMAGFVEGNAWQYTWMAPQDLPGLFHLMGGDRAAVARLDRFFTHLQAGPEAPYAWAGNEPGLEVPWEYDFAGAPERTQAVVRTILTSVYADTPAGLPGNDDLGEMSSWYVWAAMGLYPEIPGAAGLALSSPLFPRITVRWSGGRLDILAPGAPYVRSLLLNGRPYASSWLPLKAVAGDAALRFILGSHPTAR